MWQQALKDVIPLVAQHAPMIATALGSPVAGIAATILANAFGVAAKPADLLDAIQNHTDAASILCQCDNTSGGILSKLAQNGMPKYVEVTLKLDWRDSAAPV
jgi:hypothetical protein